MINFRHLIFPVSLLFPFLLFAQPANGPVLETKPFLMVQFRGMYSYGQEQLDENGAFVPVDPNLRWLLRRGRAGVRASYGKQLTGFASLSFDQIGQRPEMSTRGSGNTSLPNIALFDAFLTWQVVNSKPWLYLTMGQFRPQIGRESITSGFFVPSMEKALSQTYLRRHLVQVGHGRAPGVNAGGFILPGKPLSFTWYLGLFSPWAEPEEQTALLGTARLAMHLGDPEQEEYAIQYDVTRFGKRKGITLAASGSRQGGNGKFYDSSSLGVDLLANAGRWSLDGEWHWLWRTPLIVNIGRYWKGQTGYLRGSYAMPVGEKWLEWTAMVSSAQADPQPFYTEFSDAFSGTDNVLEFGANLHLVERKIKLQAHHCWQWGSSIGPVGNINNDYFFQQGLGEIRRGNYFGAGMVVVL